MYSRLQTSNHYFFYLTFITLLTKISTLLFLLAKITFLVFTTQLKIIILYYYLNNAQNFPLIYINIFFIAAYSNDSIGFESF